MNIRADQQVVFDGEVIRTWEDIESVYRKGIEIHGPGYKSLYFDSEIAHHRKLSHISRFFYSRITANDSVLDVGCGTGALVPLMPPCSYRGIDLVQESVEEARSRYSDLNFDCANIIDITEKYDWIIMAGLTASSPMPEKILEKAWEIAIKGMILDLIDSRKTQIKTLNSFKMGACTEFFLEMGAQGVEIYPTRYIWNVCIITKQSPWL